MDIVIDTRDGLSGDIFIAGLISLGADKKKILSAIKRAGNKLGKCSVKIIKTNPVILKISQKNNDEHLLESKGRKIIQKLISELKIKKRYADYMKRSFSELCKAEKYVHSTHPELKHHMYNPKEATLHEAQDIIIDLTGAAVAMQSLEIKNVRYIDYIGVGNGYIRFSHGKFRVPAPATERILRTKKFRWKRTGSGERFTPTGAALLAGFRAKRTTVPKIYIKKGSAKGLRPYPAVGFYLV